MTPIHLDDDVEITSTSSGRFVEVDGVHVYAAEKAQLRNETLVIPSERAEEIAHNIMAAAGREHNEEERLKPFIVVSKIGGSWTAPSTINAENPERAARSFVLGALGKEIKEENIREWLKATNIISELEVYPCMREGKGKIKRYKFDE